MRNHGREQAAAVQDVPAPDYQAAPPGFGDPQDGSIVAILARQTSALEALAASKKKSAEKEPVSKKGKGKGKKEFKKEEAKKEELPAKKAEVVPVKAKAEVDPEDLVLKNPLFSSSVPA